LQQACCQGVQQQLPLMLHQTCSPDHSAHTNTGRRSAAVNHICKQEPKQITPANHKHQASYRMHPQRWRKNFT
jgi:hypothetical protein